MQQQGTVLNEQEPQKEPNTLQNHCRKKIPATQKEPTEGWAKIVGEHVSRVEDILCQTLTEV